MAAIQEAVIQAAATQVAAIQVVATQVAATQVAAGGEVIPQAGNKTPARTLRTIQKCSR